jgi:co-chaperonin GroES (HSP10)
MENIDEKTLEYRRSLSALEMSIDFKPMNNMVLVKTYNPNKVSNGGIIVPLFYHKEIPEHAIRCSIVITPPEKLIYKKDRDKLNTAYPGRPILMEWDCEMELQKGDLVFHDYLDSMNSQTIMYEGEEYRLIPYSGCYAVKRVSYIIPLNGYILCEEIENVTKVLDYEKRDIDYKSGIARFVGKPNKSYYSKFRTDEMEVKEGDKIALLNQYAHKGARIYLEDPVHLYFDGKKYFVIQRFKIAGIIEN